MSRTATAAGFILFHGEQPKRRYLLLRNARHGTWAFPKGHLETGEELLAAARRELREETGIEEIDLIPGFRAEMAYRVAAGHHRSSPDRGYEKAVHLFLARVSSPEWTRSSEHDAGDWMTAEAVLERLTYEEMRRAFLEAVAHLARTD